MSAKTFGSTFASLKVGQSDPDVIASILSLTSTLAFSLDIPSSNSTVINETFSLDVDTMSTRFLTPLSSSSSGSVINLSISSAVFPGKTELTNMLFSFISG